MKLIAVTYSYSYEGNEAQRVVGIYSSGKLDQAIYDIKNGFGKINKLVSQSVEKEGFFLDYGAEGHFYSGTYNLNEFGKI